MKMLKMKEGIIVGTLLFCFFVIFPTTKTFGSVEDLGMGVWKRDNFNVTIIHQLTKMGPFLINVNGVISLDDTGELRPAYGTAFFDPNINKLVIAYTINFPNGPAGAVIVRLELDPATLNGTITIKPVGIGIPEPITDTVTLLQFIPPSPPSQ